VRAAFVIVLAFSANAAAQCEVRGVLASEDYVTVRPDGVAPIELRVFEPIVARPRSDRGLPAVSIRGALELTAEGTALTFRVARTLESGPLSISPYARIASIRARGERVIANVHLIPGVVARAVTIDCAALTIGEHEPSEARWQTGDGTQWMPRASTLAIRAQPDAPPIHIAVDHASLLRVMRLEQRGDLWRVAWTESYGSSIEGWVHRAALAPSDLGGAPDWWHGGNGQGCGGFGPARDVIREDATLIAGAEIFAEPGRGRWALVPADTVQLVEHTPGSEWVRLTHIDAMTERGLCDQLARAWVRRSDVVFAPE
jgi:hypothetical protein